jgi:hypothetical protein
MAAWGKEINSDSDRTAAIMAFNFLDHAIRGAIIYKLKIIGTRDEKTLHRLFEEYGVLYSTDSKIIMGRALDLYGPVTHANLDIIKSIRNTFAHSAHGLSFRTPAIASQAKKLIRMPKRLRRPIDMPYRTPRQMYIHAVMDICQIIWIAGLIDLRKQFQESGGDEGWQPLP